MTVLNRKLLRDLRRMWVQVLAIALVMACGVATLVMAVGAYRSLGETQAALYDRYRFATVFAGLTRAPEHLRGRLAAIAGVSSVELRIVRPVVLDIAGMSEPASAIVVSIPDSGEASANRLYIRSGRLPDPGRTGAVAISESFALAHSMQPGSRFSAVLNGRKVTLTASAIVLSPEYVYAIGPGDMVPDPRRFGVLFMPHSALAGLFDMEGAFNDVAIRTQRHVLLEDVIDAVDDILRPYGGRGAHGRSDQVSHAFLDAELTQLRAMALVLPPVFLFVAAFLVNMILTRVITLEREQIGLMKAIGYGSFSVGWHYAKFSLLVAMVGIALGSAAGFWLGRGLTRLYGEFFSFPFLVFRQGADLYIIAGMTSALAAVAGSSRAILGIVRLAPAIAMQPPAPTRYRTLFGSARRFSLPVPQLTMMAWRHLLRWPLRTAMTTLGTSLAVALLVTALFTYDAVDFMVETAYFQSERQDATVQFGKDLAPAAMHAVAQLPGVMGAEAFRSAAVILRNGYRQRRLAIVTISPGADLARVLDTDLRPVDAPASGLMISERVAAVLGLATGDKVEVELLEQAGRKATLSITGIVRSYIGLGAYMHPDALDRLIGNGPRLSGARILADPARLDELYTAVKETPSISSVALQSISRQRFRETIAENIGLMSGVYIALAFIITFGVVYNSARIQLSERARELASLRVLGFTRPEVSGVLLTELAAIVLLAQPLGWLIGWAFSRAVVKGLESDLFQVPFVIERSTFALASLIVVSVAIFSAMVVRNRIDRLDLISVLKTRD